MADLFDYVAIRAYFVEVLMVVVNAKANLIAKDDEDNNQAKEEKKVKI